jgi:hypothetical protein
MNAHELLVKIPGMRYANGRYVLEGADDDRSESEWLLNPEPGRSLGLDPVFALFTLERDVVSALQGERDIGLTADECRAALKITKHPMH